MLTLEITKTIPDELIAQIVEMDHAAYPPEDQMTWDRAYMIYHCIQDSLILLKEDGRLVGHLSIYAVRPDLVPLAIREQKPIFYVEEKEHLLPVVEGPCDGYLHNIILYPEYRGRGFRRYLYLGMKRWLKTHPGIRYLWADAVSEYGQRAASSLGMKACPELDRLWGGELQTVLKALDRQIAESGEPEALFL